MESDLFQSDLNRVFSHTSPNNDKNYGLKKAKIKLKITFFTLFRVNYLIETIFFEQNVFFFKILWTNKRQLCEKP